MEIPITTVRGAKIIIRIADAHGEYRWIAEPTRFGRVEGRDFCIYQREYQGRRVHYIRGIAKDGKETYIAWWPEEGQRIEQEFQRIREMQEQERTQNLMEKVVENRGADPWTLNPGSISLSSEEIRRINRMVAEETGLEWWEIQNLWLKQVGYHIVAQDWAVGKKVREIIEELRRRARGIIEERQREEEEERKKDEEMLKRAKEQGEPIRVQVYGYDGDDPEQVALYGDERIKMMAKEGWELGYVIVWKVYYPDGRITYEHEPTM